MSKAKTPAKPRKRKPSTPVDDVRRVRAKLWREAGGTLEGLVKASNGFLTPALIKKLRLKVVKPLES